MIETQEEREDKWKRKLIKVQLQEQCKNCSFLEVINLDKQIVRCPYLVKNKCLIKQDEIMLNLLINILICCGIILASFITICLTIIAIYIVMLVIKIVLNELNKKQVEVDG